MGLSKSFRAKNPGNAGYDDNKEVKSTHLHAVLGHTCGSPSACAPKPTERVLTAEDYRSKKSRKKRKSTGKVKSSSKTSGDPWSARCLLFDSGPVYK